MHGRRTESRQKKKTIWVNIVCAFLFAVVVVSVISVSFFSVIRFGWFYRLTATIVHQHHYGNSMLHSHFASSFVFFSLLLLSLCRLCFYCAFALVAVWLVENIPHLIFMYLCPLLEWNCKRRAKCLAAFNGHRGLFNMMDF